MKAAMLTAVPLLIITAPVVAQDCEWTVRDPDDQATYGCVRRFDDYPVKINQKDIVVTGALAETKSDSSYPISQITLGGNITRIENALAQAAGLQQFRRSDARSANPTSQGITLRGLGGNASSRAQLLLDDVPQADPFGGWISWPGYDTLQLASIRIRRGAGQVAAGTGALAGVVELDSLQNMDRITGAAYFGSRNSADAKAAILQSLGAGSISVSGSYTRGDGFIPIKEGQRGAVDRPAAYEQGGIAIRAVAPLSANTELQANMRAFTDDRDRGFDFSDNQNSGVDASLRVVNRTPGGWQWSALGYVQVRQFANRFGAIGAGRNSVSLTLDQFSVPSTGLGARIEVRPPLGDAAELRVGADWRRTVGETNENFFFTGLTPGRNRRAGGGSDTVGLFTEASLDLTDMLTLTAGARADHWRIADGFRKEVNIGGSVRSDDRFSDRSGWEGTGRAGIVWRSTDSFKVRGAAYLAWRLPTLNELYRPFRVGADATAANELLAPERLRGVEIGADFEKGGVTLSGTIFANRLNNAIANVGLGNGPGNFPGVGFVGAGGVFRQRRNLDAIDSKGLEIEAAYTVNLFWVRASYAFVDAQVKASGNAALLDGLRPAQVPRHFANLGIGYDGAKVRADLSGRFVSGQFEDDVNSRHLGGAFTIDGGLHYRLGTKIELELRGENLFDAQVDAAIAADGVIERAMPRTIWVGIALDF
jgi:vitamin B12 transporter